MYALTYVYKYTQYERPRGFQKTPSEAAPRYAFETKEMRVAWQEGRELRTRGVYVCGCVGVWVCGRVGVWEGGRVTGVHGPDRMHRLFRGNAHLWQARKVRHIAHVPIYGAPRRFHQGPDIFLLSLSLSLSRASALSLSVCVRVYLGRACPSALFLGANDDDVVQYDDDDE